MKKIITGDNMANIKKQNTTKEKESRRIYFEKDIYENLQTVAGVKGISVSKYINDLLRKKFAKIDDKTTIAELKKM